MKLIKEETISLEMFIGNEEDLSGNCDNKDKGDFGEKNIRIPPDIAINAGLKTATQEVLESLTEREATVLKMRFGIGMNTNHTLEEIGNQFGVTRERIRQIEAKAMRKLRYLKPVDQLRSFWE